MPPKLPPHVRMVRNKVGRPYYYLQRYRGTGKAERPQRLPDVHDPEFWSEYARLLGLPPKKPQPGLVSEVVKSWHASPEWSQLAPTTRREWTRHSGRLIEAWGDLEIRGIEPRHVLALRDAWSATPATANNLLRCLTALMSWAVPRGYRPDNPCREVKHLKGGEGYAPWPWEVIEAAQTALRPDLWWIVALALYTGQRLSDVLAMRWDAIAGGLIAVRQGKTGKRLSIPLHRDLRPVLETIPRRAVQILTDQAGVPWDAGRFQATWGRHRPAIVAERGLVFHGLRKSAVVTLLEAGCTDAEVAAVTGQSRQMVEHYAKQVNQGRLAASAILKWEQRTN